MPDLKDRKRREQQQAAAILIILSQFEDDFLRTGRFSRLRLQQELEQAMTDHLRRTYTAAAANFRRRYGKQAAAMTGYREDAARWARDHAGDSAKAIADTTKDWAADLRAKGASKEEIAEKVFSRARAEMTSISDTTDAISAAEISLASKVERKLGLRMVAIWRTEGDDRVCPICSPLDGKPKTIWGKEFPLGPKAHPRCRCWLDWEVVIP